MHVSEMDGPLPRIGVKITIMTFASNMPNEFLSREVIIMYAIVEHRLNGAGQIGNGGQWIQVAMVDEGEKVKLINL